MANEFKIKKGLIVTGASGGTVVDIQGSQGQLFSVTDDLSGSIFAVSDISGVPIFDVNSSGLSTFDGDVNLPDSKKILLGTGNDFQLYHDGTHGVLNNTTGNLYTSALGAMIFRTSLNVTALTLDASQNATFGGNLITGGAVYPATNAGASLGLSDKQWAGLDLSSSSAITWGNGDAEIVEGEVSNYSLSFKTYDGTNNSRALLLEGNNNATFTTQAFSAATSSGDASSTLTTKGYVDGLITASTSYRGTWDPDVSLNSGYGNPNLSSVTQTDGYYYICSANGAATPNGTGNEPDSWNTGDWVVWNTDAPIVPGGGTGAWQKIDNTSVLSGIGTGQTVALWEGDSSVTDSETLGNAPITVSGNDATFSGNVGVGTSPSSFYPGTHNLVVGDGGGEHAVTVYSGTTSTGYLLFADGSSGSSRYAGQVRYNHSTNAMEFSVNNSSTAKLTINSLGNATFAGNITVSGTSSSFNTGNGTFVTNDASNYPRFTANNGSAQLGLFRAGGNAGGMYIGGAGDGFRLYTSSFSQKLFIDTNGNATFAGDVLVEDNLYLTDAGTVRGKIQLNASDRDDLDIKAVSLGSNMKFFTVDTERMRITSAGLVKINPGTANNTSYDALVLSGGANSTSGSGAKMYLTGTVNDPLARGTIIEGLMTDNSNAHALIFSTSAASSAPAERMRIQSDGNVGIGTTLNLGRELLVKGEIAALDNTGTNDNQILMAVNNTIGNLAVTYGSTGSYVPFQLETSGTPRFTVSTAGAIKFNAYDSTNNTGTPTYMLGTDGSGNVVKVLGGDIPGGGGTVTGTGTATRVAFWSASDTITSDADLYWDNTNKRLGIGVSSPAALLEINGTGDAIRVESTNTGAGGAQIDLLHYSTSPADGDTMAYINMGGYYDTVPNQAYFASIRTVATDISARQGELTFWTVNSTLQQRMVIDTDGNVGIGTDRSWG